MRVRCLRCGYDKFEYNRLFSVNFCVLCGKTISDNEFRAARDMVIGV